MYGSARKSYLQMLDPIHNQGLRLCLGAFRTSPVESLYVDALKPCLGARRAKLSLQYASKIKSLLKHAVHNVVFDNKYMMLFDARPSAIRTFGLLIKTASNIEFSDILETLSRFILPPWYIKPLKIVLDLVHQYTTWKFETGTMITFLFIQITGCEFCGMCYSLSIGHRILYETTRDSASIFTLEIWAIWKKLKMHLHPNSQFLQTHCIQALLHMKLEHPLIGMVCLFKYCQ